MIGFCFTVMRLKIVLGFRLFDHYSNSPIVISAFTLGFNFCSISESDLFKNRMSFVPTCLMLLIHSDPSLDISCDVYVVGMIFRVL